jgi:hypothetical protein
MRFAAARSFAALLAGTIGLIGCEGGAGPQGPGGTVIDGRTVVLSGALEQLPAWKPELYPAPASLPGIDRALEAPRSADLPEAYRTTVTLGPESWLVAELYSRRPDARVDNFLRVVKDPDSPGKQVLRLSTPAHTDGLILRSRSALPDEYRISLRIGHIDYGGTDARNGYDDGSETGEPWMPISALGHNGIYWGAILDTEPRPQANIWSHHHRKFFIDTWNYRKRMLGVTVAAVDGRGTTDPRVGKPFIAFDGHEWQRNSVEPAFFYLPDQWYDVVIERRSGELSFSVSGEFHGIGNYNFEGALDIRENCIYHYNRSQRELDRDCLLGDVLETETGLAEVWPLASAYPDYFMLGDPHTNFYEGSVLVDTLRLEAL